MKRQVYASIKETPSKPIHDITSTIHLPLSKYDEEALYDFVESLSDYASMRLNYGYVSLADYQIDNQTLHCYYDYICYNTNNTEDSIDFIISFNHIDSIADLDSYLYEFADKISESFEGVQR